MPDIKRHRFFLDDSPNSKSAVFVSISDLREALLSDEAIEAVARHYHVLWSYYKPEEQARVRGEIRPALLAALTAIGLGEQPKEEDGNG